MVHFVHGYLSAADFFSTESTVDDVLIGTLFRAGGRHFVFLHRFPSLMLTGAHDEGGGASRYIDPRLAVLHPTGIEINRKVFTAVVGCGLAIVNMIGISLFRSVRIKLGGSGGVQLLDGGIAARCV